PLTTFRMFGRRSPFAIVSRLPSPILRVTVVPNHASTQTKAKAAKGRDARRRPAGPPQGGRSASAAARRSLAGIPAAHGGGAVLRLPAASLMSTMVHTEARAAHGQDRARQAAQPAED